MHPFTTIIFDIGDVLFTWSSVTKTTISSRTLHQILSSHIWHDYERGLISQQVCYETVGNEFSLDPAEIGKAFDQARDSLCCNEDMIAFIRELKCKSNGRLRIFAMSNISLPDYNVLRTKPADWSIFDRVFPSCTAGQRKPDLSFYRHVIAEANVDPSRTIFVDDKLDNVISARSLGFHGIVFDSSKNVINTLRNITGDPIQRGQAYLKLHAGKHHSFADNDNELKENFAQLLLLEMTNDSYVFGINWPLHSVRSFLYLIGVWWTSSTTHGRGISSKVRVTFSGHRFLAHLSQENHCSRQRCSRSILTRPP